MRVENAKLVGFFIYFILLFLWLHYSYNYESDDRLKIHLGILVLLILIFFLPVRKGFINPRKSTIGLISISFLILIMFVLLDIIYFKTDDYTRIERESMQLNDKKVIGLYHKVKYKRKDYINRTIKEKIEIAKTAIKTVEETKFIGHLSPRWWVMNTEIQKQISNHQRELNEAISELKIVEENKRKFYTEFPLNQKACVEVYRADLLSNKKEYCGTIINHNVSSQKIQIKITSVNCKGLLSNTCKGNACSGWKDVTIAADQSGVIGIGDSVWIPAWCVG